MSFGFGSPQGSARWIAELDVTKFKQGTATLKQEFTSLSQQTKTLAGGVSPLTNSFNPLNATVNKTSQSFGALGSNFSQLRQTMDAQGRSLTSATKLTENLGGSVQSTGQRMSKFGGYLKNNMTSVGVLAGGIAGLDNQFLALHKAQVANERANLMVVKANNRVEDTQKRLNDMIAKGGKGTANYNALLKDLQIAQDSAALAAERHGKHDKDST